MKELVVISGKGGTGKTSIVASFAALAGKTVIADCDVDAADLHLVLEPKTIRAEEFTGGKVARIIREKCSACGLCKELCRFGAVVSASADAGGNPTTYSIDENICEGCGACAWFCKDEAIRLDDAIDGDWFVSETRHGFLVHARLRPGGENSGKLVTQVRESAKKLAEENGLELVIIDGPPGIGCPVIASLTGARMALIVTEPSLSGLHDADRVIDLTEHFDIPTAVCINKHDINTQVAGEIERKANERGLRILGKLDYDNSVTEAQFNQQSVVEHSEGVAAKQMTGLWRSVAEELGIRVKQVSKKHE